MFTSSVRQTISKAKLYADKGEIVHARSLLDAVLKDFPNNKSVCAELDALNRALIEIENSLQNRQNTLIVLYNQQRFREASEQAEQLTSEYPNSFVLWNVFGASYKALGDFRKAEHGFRRAADINSTDSRAHYNLANVLQVQGKLDESISAYQRALAIKPEYVDAYYNLGNALQTQGKLNESISAYQRALAIKPDYVDAYYNLGIALQTQGKLDESISVYQRVLNINGDYVSAHINIGNALHKKGKLDESISAYQRALAIKPDCASAHNNMGVILREQGKLEEAISAYQRALLIKSDYASAHNNMANALRELGDLDGAIAAYERAIAIKPDYFEAEVQMLHTKQHVCDFSVASELPAASAYLGILTKAVPPFALLSWSDNAEQQLLRAKNWASEKYKCTPSPFAAKPKARSERLKVGYFSADFHDHATMYLMAGTFREHDRKHFKIFCYSYGRIKFGELRKKVEGNADQFYDVFGSSDREIAKLAREDGLDIAIDLKGYTQNMRSSIFQYRPAPIQINYLGYPGSMGADFIDYMIADPIVLPLDQRQFYSEKVIYLPHSYFPADNTYKISEVQTIRADFGLPEDAFVFCCFNNNYKISPREFNIWMRLLNNVDGSILWLLKSNIWAEANLRKEAELRGIDPGRLVFAEKLPNAQHLARHKHADLFIDTFNYGAHTTACDALWAGLPVVTKQGKQFAARVAASLLTAAGLTELITETEQDYERVIFELANKPERLASIKAKLANNRLKAAIFDTKRYTRNLERGLRQVYDLYVDNKPPEDIWVSDVARQSG